MFVKGFYTYKDKWDAAIRRKIECIRGTPTKEHHDHCDACPQCIAVHVVGYLVAHFIFKVQNLKGDVTGASSVQTSHPDSPTHT